MLRHDSRAHPRNGPHDQAAQPAADRADRESGCSRAAEAGGPLGREIAVWQAVGCRGVGDQRRACPAAGLRSRFHGGQEPHASRAWRDGDQHPRRSPGQRPHLAADHGRADPPRGPDRADPPFLLPRPQPDRHAGRSPGLCGLRRAEHPLRDRRSAQAGRLSATPPAFSTPIPSAWPPCRSG